MTVIDPREAPALRWGVIAPGGIARTFAHAVRSATRSTVVAVGSRDAGRAAAFAQEFDIPRSYGDYASVAADQEVEAVYVASPHSEHRDHALLALRTGKPVLVEKALARNEREVHQMFAAAEEANLFANRREFGLNFERHTPEAVALPGRPISVGDEVRFLPPRGRQPLSRR